MYYKESKQILQSIKAAKKILLVCHFDPDADALGSLLGLGLALKMLDVNLSLVCRDKLPEYLEFLPKSKLVKIADFNKLNLEDYDLIIALDSSTWGRIVGDDLEQIKHHKNIIAIDHHRSNTNYGKLNLVDANSTSTSEIIYKILQDCNFKIDKNIAQCLLTGIIGDTGSFRYPGLTSDTFSIASDLLKKGADRDKINFELYFNVEFKELKYLSTILDNAVLDKKTKIVWSAISNDVYKKLDEPEGSGFAGTFFQTIKDTEVGVFMVEKEKNILEVSFRSRKNVDVAKIAVELGGGGHKKAAGVKIKDMHFDQAVKKVLSTVRKYTN